VATKKQIILPLVVFSIGVGGLVGISALKQPPEVKPAVDTTPFVSVEEIQYRPMTFSVSSYGVVNAKYQTDMVSQVNGEIVYLADSFVKGGFVRKGDVLARIDASDYESALLDAQANLASAKAALTQERANGIVAEKERALITHSTPTALSLRKPQLAQEIARQKSAEAGLQRAQRDLERTVIRAPYDALIAGRDIGLGSYVSKGSPLGSLLSTDVAEIRLPLADKEMQYLHNKGIDARVSLSGDVAGHSRQWHGKIVRSEGVVDNKSRMTYLVAEVVDPYGLKTGAAPAAKSELRYGSYVTAQIKGSHANNVAIVPRHLVVNGQIATLNDDNTLRYQSVDIIRQQGANVVIAEGLGERAKLITSALDYPLEGMKLALPKDKLLQKQPQEQLAMGKED
jgi:RND family efflux transporter MFP subunit